MTAAERELIRELIEAMKDTYDPAPGWAVYAASKASAALRRAEAWLAEPASESVSSLPVAMSERSAIGEDIQRLTAQLAEREATLAEVRADLREAVDALTDHGYRRSCDTPACNCGMIWAHGGHANERLREIVDALGEHRQGRTILGAVQTVVAERDRLAAERERLLGELDNLRGARERLLAMHDRLTAELAEAKIALQAEREGAEIERRLRIRERDAAQSALMSLGGELVGAQAALAQANATIEVWQREAQSAREEADTVNAKALRWAAEEVRIEGRRRSSQAVWNPVADRIERGPQPAERGEEE